MTAGTTAILIEAEPRASRGLWRDALGRLRHNGPAMLGVVFITIFVVTAIFAPLIAPYDPSASNLIQSKQPPSLAHPMGTDLLGRDEFSRVVYGARVSLTVGVVAVFFGLLLGTLMGAAAGGIGGKVDTVLMRVTDVMLAVRGLPPAIIDVAGLGFLGLGPGDPRIPEWGEMLTDSARFLQSAAWLILFPGLSIVISAVGFNLLGDGLRESIDPRLKR